MSKWINASFSNQPHCPFLIVNSSKEETLSGLFPGLYIRKGTGLLLCVRVAQGVG